MANNFSAQNNRVKLKLECSIITSPGRFLSMNNTWMSVWISYHWYSMYLLSALFLSGVTAQDTEDGKWFSACVLVRLCVYLFLKNCPAAGCFLKFYHKFQANPELEISL